MARRRLSACLLALRVRELHDRFPAEIAHSGLQVRDGDSLGVFQIGQCVQDLVGRVASYVGAPGTLIMKRVFGMSLAPLAPLRAG